MTRILITPRSMTQRPLEEIAELDPLRVRGWELISGPPGRMPTERELLELVPGVDGWIAGVEPITERVLDTARKLRVISRNGVGADAIDRAAATARGVQVMLARGTNSRGVAELALTLILAGLRDVPSAAAAMRDGGWSRTLGSEITDHTVGIVGYGAVGRIVGDLVTAIGGQILAYDAYASPPVEVRVDCLEELFSRSTVVTLHTPPAADGSRLVSAELLRSMRPGGVLVNTARSGLVDEDAVLEALASGTLAAYAVDAHATEPPQLTPLLRHPRTIMTPHLGGYTDASTRRATVAAVEGVISILGRDDHTTTTAG